MKSTPVKLLSFLLFTSAISLCAASTPPKALFSGFYVGAATGVTDVSDAHDLTFDGGKVRTYLYDFSNETNLDEAPNAIAFLGYGKSLHPFYVGGELSVDFAHPSFQSETNDLVIHSQRNTELTAQLRLGYPLGESSMIYGLLGAARTTFDRKVDFISGGLYNREKHDGSLTLNNFNKEIVSYGPKIGLGFSQSITKHLSLRLEYSAIFYDSDQIDLNDYTYHSLNPPGKYCFNTNTQALNIGMSYTMS